MVRDIITINGKLLDLLKAECPRGSRIELTLRRDAKMFEELGPSQFYMEGMTHQFYKGGTSDEPRTKITGYVISLDETNRQISIAMGWDDETKNPDLDFPTIAVYEDSILSYNR